MQLAAKFKSKNFQCVGQGGGGEGGDKGQIIREDKVANQKSLPFNLVL